MGIITQRDFQTLNQSDSYAVICELLYALKENPKYCVLSELAYILDKDSFLRFFQCSCAYVKSISGIFFISINSFSVIN